MAREDLPHIQFYIGDWRKDVGVQSLSYHHRGIWLELLMLMHCSEDRGKLVLNGTPMSDAALARLLGLAQRDATNAIEELVCSGVASRDDRGTLFCRRMVRDAEKRNSTRERVSKHRKRICNADVTPNDTDNDVSVDKGRAGKLEEVAVFCREIGLPRTDAEWFWHKCEANGWTNGDKEIRDWKATLRSWKAAGYVPSIKNPRKGVVPIGEAKQPPRELPERFRAWLLQKWPDKRETVAQWKTFADLPAGIDLYGEWKRETKQQEAA